MVYEIIERTTSANGQAMLFPETEINMYWTSLDVSDEEIIALHHNHAVCEQYHCEIKKDMGVERLPSGKFETNALILKLTMISYNILRIIDTEPMKKHGMPVRHSSIMHRRIRTVIDNLILIAGHLTSHVHKLRALLSTEVMVGFMRSSASPVLFENKFLFLLNQTIKNLGIATTIYIKNVI